MTKDEALRLAEEALGSWKGEGMYINCHWTKEDEKALAAIRAALVDTVDISPERVDETVEGGHEPVAWIDPKDLEVLLKLKENYQSDTICGYQMNKNAADPKDRGVPLYTAPVEPVKQEPVASVQAINGVTIGYLEKMLPLGTKLYTTTQPRKDVDLTDDEINEVYEKWGAIPYLAAIHAVIEAFKDKNSA